jgi:hypothetical protein
MTYSRIAMQEEAEGQIFTEINGDFVVVIVIGGFFRTVE